jgi:hypothetical protein
MLTSVVLALPEERLYHLITVIAMAAGVQLKEWTSEILKLSSKLILIS